MIKKICTLLILLNSLSSCLTTSESELYTFSTMLKEKDIVLDVEVEVPEVELFISAPFTEVFGEELLEADGVLIPEENIPIREFIEKTITVNKPVDLLPREIILDDRSDIFGETKENSIIEANIPADELLSSFPPNQVIVSRDQNSTVGREFLIELDKEGWIYSGSESRSIEMKKRDFTGDTTKFIFSISDAGSYLLSFYLQDSSSGKSEEVEYNMSIETLDDSHNQPIVIEPELENEMGVDNSEDQEEILLAVEEENIPELVASFEFLISEDDPVENTVLSEAFDLLERQGGYDRYLVDLAENAYLLYPYDNQSAELLYKAALTVEKPGPGQNIEKALSLFKLVREHFPISIYCDKSEERIRYLERHFMKIY